MIKGSISQFENFANQCECGYEHRLQINRILFAGGVVAQLPTLVKDIMPTGKILFICYESGREELISRCKELLKKDGYDIVVHTCKAGQIPTLALCGELFNYPEDIRLVISFGGDTAVQLARYYCSIKEIKYICIAEEYDNLSLFESIARLYTGGRQNQFTCTYAHAVIYDLDFLQNPTNTQIASLYGFVMSFSLALFDLYFSYAIDGQKYCDFTLTSLESIVDSVVGLSEGLVRGERKALIECLDAACRLQIFAAMSQKVSLNATAKSVTDFLFELKIGRKQSLRRQGEVLFWVAKKAVKVCELLMDNPIRDLGFPPDKGMRADKIQELFGGDRFEILKNLEYMSVEDYQIRQLRLQEYREDMKQYIHIVAQKIAVASKTIKRIYSDLGFSFSKAMSFSDLKIAVSLSPDISQQYTFLTLLRDMGLLDSYLR